MQKLLFILLVCFALTSCGIVEVKGSFQGLYSYYKKTNNTNPELYKPYNGVIENHKNNQPYKVLIINGIDLQKEIKSFDRVLVYNWSPKCKSQFCPSLNLLQNNCKEKGIELFIVAEYYDVALMQKSYQIKRPVLGIDTKYYKSNLTHKYIKRFYNDITNKKYDSKIYHRFFYFEKGVFIKRVHSIEEL